MSLTSTKSSLAAAAHLHLTHEQLGSDSKNLLASEPASRVGESGLVTKSSRRLAGLRQIHPGAPIRLGLHALEKLPLLLASYSSLKARWADRSTEIRPDVQLPPIGGPFAQGQTVVLGPSGGPGVIWPPNICLVGGAQFFSPPGNTVQLVELPLSLLLCGCRH